MILAKRIAHDKWLTNADIHRITGLDQSIISKVLNGRSRPYGSEARKIADCLGYNGDMGELFEEEDCYCENSYTETGDYFTCSVCGETWRVENAHWIKSFEYCP